MLRVLSFVCLLGCALVSSPALCEAAGWSSSSQHAPADAWTSSPDAGDGALASREFESAGHGRLVSPRVWEHYSRRPVVRSRRSVVTPTVIVPQEPVPAREVTKTVKKKQVVKPAPKKAVVSTPPKAVETAPKPAEAASPAPAPAAPAVAPVTVKEELQPKAVTPPAAPEPQPDNVSASWIIRRDSAPSQEASPDHAAPSPVPVPQTSPPPPTGEDTAAPGSTISAPWIMPAPSAPPASPGTASEAPPAPDPVSPETPASPGT